MDRLPPDALGSTLASPWRSVIPATALAAWLRWSVETKTGGGTGSETSRSPLARDTTVDRGPAWLLADGRRLQTSAAGKSADVAQYLAQREVAMPSMQTSTCTIVARLRADAWTETPRGKHNKLEHPDRPGVLLVVPRHKEQSPGVARSIARLAGWT